MVKRCPCYDPLTQCSSCAQAQAAVSVAGNNPPSPLQGASQPRNRRDRCTGMARPASCMTVRLRSVTDCVAVHRADVAGHGRQPIDQRHRFLRRMRSAIAATGMPRLASCMTVRLRSVKIPDHFRQAETFPTLLGSCQLRPRLPWTGAGGSEIVCDADPTNRGATAPHHVLLAPSERGTKGAQGNEPELSAVCK